jgi:hypothetical protein
MKTDKHMENAEKGLFSGEFLDTWHGNYGKLEALGRQQGTFTGAMEEELARWVDIQRRIRHMLPGELKEKLAALDIDFEAVDSSWEAMCRQLAGFVEKHGHACLPDDPRHETLRDWLNRQILSKSLLSESQVQRLGSLGIDWGQALSRDHRWELMLSRLQAFREAFGHCRVPQRWSKDRQLALWVTVQRRVHAQGKMREDRKRRLTELGFTWSIQDVFEAQWEEYFQELVSFHQAHGHCRVPCKYEKLVSWIERQRTAKVKNLLSADRVEQLNRIGFIWSFEKIKRENWEERYRQLRAYWQKHGHSFVPVNCKENKSLGTWVATQRRLEAKGKLGAAKKKKLSELGFVWGGDTQSQLMSVYDAQWEAGFEKLKAYWRAHGTCQVSVKADPVLQRWTRWQRKQFCQGSLSAERIDRLNEIRFPWSVQEGYWMRMYDALLDFRKAFGHTRVPSQWEPNPRLAAWAYRTRRDKQELTSQKVELLDGIGFDWALHHKTVVPWGVMYGRLVAFRQQQGHTRVPVKWKEDPKLGKWAGRMRYQRERLAPERAALLEAIGFDWGCRLSSGKTADGHTNPVYLLAAAL